MIIRFQDVKRFKICGRTYDLCGSSHILLWKSFEAFASSFRNASIAGLTAQSTWKSLCTKFVICFLFLCNLGEFVIQPKKIVLWFAKWKKVYVIEIRKKMNSYSVSTVLTVWVNEEHTHHWKGLKLVPLRYHEAINNKLHRITKPNYTLHQKSPSAYRWLSKSGWLNGLKFLFKSNKS